MPALTVFVKVKIFTPFNKVIDFVFKLVVLQIVELLIIEGIVIERLKLFLEMCRFNSSLVDRLTLLCNQLSILSIAIELA